MQDSSNKKKPTMIDYLNMKDKFAQRIEIYDVTAMHSLLQPLSPIS